MIEDDRPPGRTVAATAAIFLPAAPIAGLIDGIVGTPDPVEPREEAKEASQTVNGRIPQRLLYAVVLAGTCLFNAGRKVGAVISK